MHRFAVIAAAALLAAPALAADLKVLRPLPSAEPYYGEMGLRAIVELKVKSRSYV